MTAAPTVHPFVPDPRRWRVLGVLSTALFMSLIDVSIVNVALPSIQNGLAASDSQIQWILAGYALTFGVGLVAFGRAGDLFGRGPLFIAGVAVFTLSSAWAGFASDPLWLNVARAVEGLGSGLISPQVVGMIQQYFRGAERARAFGTFGAVVGVSVAIGPVLGGVLIALGGPENGWRWIFFVNIPVGIAAIALALLWFPKPLFTKRDEGSAAPGTGGAAAGAGSPASAPGDAAGVRDGLAADRARPRRTSRDLDPVGTVLLGLAVLAVLLPFMESSGSPWLWASAPVGLALLAAWVAWELHYRRRGRQPMVDIAIFRVASFTNGTVIVGLYFLGMTSIWVLVALYFQDGLGYSALATGLVGLPSSILSGIAALWAGRLVARHGRRVVIAGLYSAIAGVLACIAVAVLHAHAGLNEWWLMAGLALIGIAQGSVISPNQALTLAEVPLEYAGSSGGIMQTVQRIGTSVGIAVVTSIAFAVLRASNWSTAFTVGFAVIAVVVLIALFVAYRDRRRRHGQVLL